MRDLKIYAKTIEQEAVEQVNTLLNQPAFHDCKVRIMPDTHAGKGCVIGFTANLGDKVIPNIVGVDIGCGMLTVNLGKIEIDFEKLDRIIRQFVPYGRNIHEGRIVKFPKILELACYRELVKAKRFERSIGTLGGGNHFIEIDIDQEYNKYLVIHTGSRNLGKQVADFYQELAYDIMRGKDKFLEKKDKIIKEYKEQGRKNEIQQCLKELQKEYQEKEIDMPKELCYLEGPFREQYLHDMKICQEFAVLNRKTIEEIILDKMELTAVQSFETIHNYIDMETNIVRKGAIRAQKDEMLLIPINMKDGCILGLGTSKPKPRNGAARGLKSAIVFLSRTDTPSA